MPYLEGIQPMKAGTMEFQSPEHERSYRLACRAVAHARREAYRTAAGMTTAELRRGVTDYVRATGQWPARGSEAASQVHMIASIIRRRNERPARASRAGR